MKNQKLYALTAPITLPLNLILQDIGVLNASAEYICFTPQEKTGLLLTDTNSFQVLIMTEQKNKDDFLKKWESTSGNLLKWYIPKFKSLLKRLVKFVPIIIGYSFMSWMFIGVYDTIGFEKTLIILLVGVFWYGIRQKV